MLRPATPLTLLLFVAFVLLLLSVLSTPIVKAIPLASFKGVDFGVFGYCKPNGQCTGFQIGYATDSSTLFGDSKSDFSIPNGARSSLSSILIVHPIAALLTLICTILAASSHLHSPSHSPRFLLALLILLIPTLLVTLLAFLVDILLFVPHMKWGGWIVLVSTILIVASGVVTCAMRRTLVSRKARKKRIAENAEMSGKNFYEQQNAAAPAGARAESPPPLVSGPPPSMGNGPRGADKLPTFTTYEKNPHEIEEDRIPLNSRTPSNRTLPADAFHARPSDEGFDFQGVPGRGGRGPRGGMRGGRGGFGGPRDEFGNPLPSSNAFGPVPPVLVAEVAEAVFQLEDTDEVGSVIGAEACQWEWLLELEPACWPRTRGLAVDKGRLQTMVMPILQWEAKELVSTNKEVQWVTEVLRRQHTVGDRPGHRQRQAMVDNHRPDHLPIREVSVDSRRLEADQRLEVTDDDSHQVRLQPQETILDRDPSLIPEATIRLGANLPLGAIKDHEPYVPLRAAWSHGPNQGNATSTLNLPPQNVVSPVGDSPVAELSAHGSRSPLVPQLTSTAPNSNIQTNISGHNRYNSADNYYEDVDPRFAEPPQIQPPLMQANAPLPSALTAGLHPHAPQHGIIENAHNHSTGHLQPSQSYDSIPENTHDAGARSPAISDGSNYTSISQRGINPQWQPPPDRTMGMGGVPNRRPVGPSQRDVLNSNPDFELPIQGGRAGGGRLRAASRGHREPGMIPGMEAGGGGRYPGNAF
ncbi:MAG: hypothetical protein Q9203_006503 [Teloschistes exilis]